MSPVKAILSPADLRRLPGVDDPGAPAPWREARAAIVIRKPWVILPPANGSSYSRAEAAAMLGVMPHTVENYQASGAVLNGRRVMLGRLNKPRGHTTEEDMTEFLSVMNGREVTVRGRESGVRKPRKANICNRS